MLLAAVLLSPAVMNDAPLLTPGAADAARDAPQGPPNAAQQRKEIIERLDAIDERLESLEGAMSDGLNVRVVNFPDDSGEDDSDRAADTTDRTPRVRRTGG
jgi:anion-transporting  ArsA/GET3 family ATPase